MNGASSRMMILFANQYASQISEENPDIDVYRCTGKTTCLDLFENQF